MSSEPCFGGSLERSEESPDKIESGDLGVPTTSVSVPTYIILIDSIDGKTKIITLIMDFLLPDHHVLLYQRPLIKTRLRFFPFLPSPNSSLFNGQPMLQVINPTPE